MMKEYDVIAIGTGSAMFVVDGMMRQKPDLKVAVVDKDEPLQGTPPVVLPPRFPGG